MNHETTTSHSHLELQDCVEIHTSNMVLLIFHVSQLVTCPFDCVAMCQLYLDVYDKTRDSAAFMLSKFLTRPDVKMIHLAPFVDWTLQRMSQSEREFIIDNYCDFCRSTKQ